MDRKRHLGLWLSVEALLLAAGVQAQQPPSPYLYITMIQGGKQVRPSGASLEASGQERLRMYVCMETRGSQGPFEQLEIKARNQHPDYFRARPGPNVTLSVTRIAGGRRAEVPFRVFSSGGGKSLTVYDVAVDIDILEDVAERKRKAENYLDWMSAQIQNKQDAGAPLGIALRDPGRRQQLIDLIEEQYVRNPGDYEIVARYQPVGPGDHWKGTLVSLPLRVHIPDGPDSFDRMKRRAAGPAAQPPSK